MPSTVRVEEEADREDPGGGGEGVGIKQQSVPGLLHL